MSDYDRAMELLRPGVMVHLDKHTTSVFIRTYAAEYSPKIWKRDVNPAHVFICTALGGEHEYSRDFMHLVGDEFTGWVRTIDFHVIDEE